MNKSGLLLNSSIQVVLLFCVTLILPWLLPDYVNLLCFLWVMIILALSWDIIGGQMGYNSFGNIFFFGLGMYTCAVIQVMYTDQALPLSYFNYLAIGMLAGAVISVIVAALLGLMMLSMRGHYFAICTLGLGIAAAEIASGIEFIGAGSGMVPPLYPVQLDLRDEFFYFLLLVITVLIITALHFLYRGKFGLVINAIRDDEDKAEAMGLHTTRYKTIAWCISAFFLALTGALAGNLIGFIDPMDTAFAGSTFGVWMILMAILGGRGTIIGPILGAILFYIAKETFWTYLLGWNRVALGVLILLIVLYLPNGIVGWLNDRRQIHYSES